MNDCIFLYIFIPTDAFVRLHNSDTVYLASKFHISRFGPHAQKNVWDAYVIPCLAYLCFPTPLIPLSLLPPI